MKDLLKKLFEENVPGFTADYIREIIPGKEFFIIGKGQTITANFKATFSPNTGWFIDTIE